MAVIVQIRVIGTKEDIKKRAKIDTDSSIGKIKNDLVKLLDIGDAADFYIAASPSQEKTPMSNLKLEQEDTLFLIKKDSIAETSVELINDK